jgi:hypothetical protein
VRAYQRLVSRAGWWLFRRVSELEDASLVLDQLDVVETDLGEVVEGSVEDEP